MLKQDRISEFIYTLITYAKNEDIETFLKYSFESSASLFKIYKEEEKKLEYVTESKYKILLLQYLFDHAYSYIETEIMDIIDIIKQGSDYIDVCDYRERGWYDPLYMNLYALCQCYYSYMQKPEMGDSTEHKPRTSSIRYSSITKLLHLLITSATTNKFYYLFKKDKLLKIKIRKKTEKEVSRFFSDNINKQGLIYSISEYILLDEKDKTYLVNIDEKEIIDSIDKDLLRQEIYDFATIKILHNKIVSILSYKNTKEKYIKNEYDKLVEKSGKLFDKLASLQDAIHNEEPNKDILEFKKINFKEKIILLDDCSPRSTKEIKRIAKKDLEDYINKLKKNIEKENDEFVYGNISKLIKETELLISEILGN